MRWPFGPPHLTLKPSKKTKTKPKKQDKKQTKKTNKEGLGPSEAPPKKQKKTKKTKKQEKKEAPPKKTAKIPKNSFRIISQSFPFFLLAFQNFLFLTPWPKKRAPPKHHKNRGFRHFFLKSRCASRNGHFWTKKPKFINSNYHFFCLFSSLSTTKNQKNAETPIFIVF